MRERRPKLRALPARVAHPKLQPDESRALPGAHTSDDRTERPAPIHSSTRRPTSTPRWRAMARDAAALAAAHAHAHTARLRSDCTRPSSTRGAMVSAGACEVWSSPAALGAGRGRGRIGGRPPAGIGRTGGAPDAGMVPRRGARLLVLADVDGAVAADGKAVRTGVGAGSHAHVEVGAQRPEVRREAEHLPAVVVDDEMLPAASSAMS